MTLRITPWTRFKDRQWLRRLWHQYDKGIDILKRCPSGSEAETFMAGHLFRLEQILVEAEERLKRTGTVRP